MNLDLFNYKVIDGREEFTSDLSTVCQLRYQVYVNECGFEKANMAELCTCLFLGKAHRSYIRLAEHRGGYKVIVHRVFQGAELAAGEGHSLCQGYRGQFHTAGNVAQGKNTGLGRAVRETDGFDQVRVDDRSLRSRSDPRLGRASGCRRTLTSPL